jgi:hypothetical protein
MKTNIIIIDDFYENPYEIRQYALSLNYPEPQDGYTYPGKNSDGEYYNEEVHTKIENRLGQYVESVKQKGQSGYFRLSTKSESFQQDIHVDPIWDIGGVLFLNPPNQCEPDAGTSFWIHNRLQIESVPRTPEEGRILGYPQYEDVRRELIYGDGLDRSKWTCYCKVPYKFNRLVLFDPFLWHSHGTNFGTTKENTRLVQLFFLNYQK